MADQPRVPIWDNHFHLDPAGRGREAVKEFKRAGGTHLLLVHKPYHDLPPGDLVRTRAALDRTSSMAEWVREEGVVCHVALAPHPAELTEMMKAGASLEEAARLYEGSLELAARLAVERGAVALGEVGRPHYPVGADVWEEANRLMDRALELCKDSGLAAILHTESATPEVFADLASHARRVGIALDKCVKHHAPPIVDVSLNHGLFPSVVVGKDAAETALAQGTRFFMETDYMDDPARPGGVLGPRTVPRRTLELIGRGVMTEAQAVEIHKANPERTYGVSVRLSG